MDECHLELLPSCKVGLWLEAVYKMLQSGREAEVLCMAAGSECGPLDQQVGSTTLWAASYP